MPEEITGTAPETAPAEVIAAAAQPESQQETPGGPGRALHCGGEFRSAVGQ